MGDKTGIEWTDATWNPTTGCTKVSQGCKNCYAKYQAWPRLKASKGTVYFGREFEDVEVHPQRLTVPLHWRKPRRIFVNSMSDLFHESITFEFIDRVFAVMAADNGHQFQILTKRPERMRRYMMRGDGGYRGAILAAGMAQRGEWPKRIKVQIKWPLPNVWLGISAEDQETYDERIAHLRMTPAAVRWVSAEPLLGPINLGLLKYQDCADRRGRGIVLTTTRRALDWVVVGGESGSGARPMIPGWARSLRDQCVTASVAFYFKQWGALPPIIDEGKPNNGRVLDGQSWDQYPTKGEEQCT